MSKEITIDIEDISIEVHSFLDCLKYDDKFPRVIYNKYADIFLFGNVDKNDETDYYDEITADFEVIVEIEWVDGDDEYGEPGYWANFGFDIKQESLSISLFPSIVSSNKRLTEILEKDETFKEVLAYAIENVCQDDIDDQINIYLDNYEGD